MCLGMNPAARVRPTERGIILGTWLFYLMISIMIITLLSFYAGGSSAFYSLILCMIGLCAVDKCPCNCNNLGQRFGGPQQQLQGVNVGPVYNIEQLLCVVFFSGYLWVITLVYLILFLAELNSRNHNDAKIAIALIAYFGGLILYGASLYIGKQLYDELRLNYSPIQALGQQGGPMGMGGPGAPGILRSAPRQSQQSYEQTNSGVGNIGPSTNTSYKPFQGKGYSLND